MKIPGNIKNLFSFKPIKAAGISDREYQAVLDFSWIDEFINNVRSYIFVREEDNILIKRPNQAQKLNPQGAKILKALLDGQSINQLFDQVGREQQKIRDIVSFIRDVKKQLEGKLDIFSESPAVEVEPLEMRFSELPILSEIAVTYRCNLKCQFCYAGCNCTTNPVGSDREMSVPEIKKVLEKIFCQAKVPSVSFTGGEATLRPELPELVRYAKKLGMRVNLITNGTKVTPDLASLLADAGLDSAQVSLEGVSPEIHDKVTAVKHSFPKTISAVKNLKKAGILTHTNTTINKVNLHECTQIPHFVKNEFDNTKFSMNLIIPTGSAAINDELVVLYSELGPYLKAIIEESKREDVEFIWYSPTPMCMFNPIVHGLGNKGCSACDGLISVGANGDVIPCASYDDSVGNLLVDDFSAIWQSKKVKDYQNKFLAHPECRECDNFHICNGACPLYWRQIGFDELSKHNGFRPVDMSKYWGHRPHFVQVRGRNGSSIE